MRRISGQPEKKQRYLTSLDEKQFPFLIADILYFIYNHSDIKILDGPGDGRRDILSKNKEGKICITQCKFHKNFSKSVSSRETDEIVIALAKFKTKNGMFVTTGKLSPQAKREFISDFTDYELSFLEGIEIVDIVLSNPILTSVWINNESIELTSKTLILPFLLRNTKEDKPETLELNKLPKDLVIESGTTSKEYFHPYRSPSIATLKESGTFLGCYNIIYKGPIQLHQLNELTETFIDKLAPLIHKQFDQVSIRFGTPFFAEKIEDEFKGKIVLEIEPVTFVFCNGKRFTEQEFTIPISDLRLIFPRRFGVLEAPWAAWLIPDIDACLQIDLPQPFDIQRDIFTLNMKDVHLEKLNESLFFVATKKQTEELSSILNKNELPEWDCEYGFDGHIIGWRHPYLSNEGDSRSFKIKDGRFILDEDEPENKKFKSAIARIEKKLLANGFQKCSTKKAITLSSESSEPLFLEPSLLTHDSAYLFHDFHEIPSPIFFQSRLYSFVCIWDVPSFQFGSETIDFMNKVKIKSGFDLSVSFDIKTTWRRTNKYARLDLQYNVPANLAAIEFFDKILPEVKSIIDKIQIKLKSRHKDAKRITEKYWENEIGIYFRI
jgi:Restriction endonuclease